MWADFNAARPQVLGLLLTAASTALRNLPTLHLPELPRLADFGRWVEAGAPAFGWDPGTFLEIYDGNRASADELALDGSPIGPTLLAFMADRNEWEGTASELLAALSERVSETTRKERDWPKRAHSLSGQVKRIAPNLRRLGIDVNVGERETTGQKRRLVRLQKRDAAKRHQCHQRHFAHGNGDAGDAAGVAEASLGVTEVSPSGDGYPQHDADFFDDQTSSGAGDAGDTDWGNASQPDCYPTEPDRWTA